jgi:hypothetical protein
VTRFKAQGTRKKNPKTKNKVQEIQEDNWQWAIVNRQVLICLLQIAYCLFYFFPSFRLPGKAKKEGR